MGSGDGQGIGRPKVYAFSDGLFLSRIIKNTARGGRDGSVLKSNQLEAALSQGCYVYYVYKERPSEKRVGIFRRPSLFQTIGTGFAA